MASWDDEQYLKFAEERTRPAEELLARVPVDKPHRVIDLGCGPGNSTQLLSDRWPFADVRGVDSSPEMLQRARRDLPTVEFIEADLRTYRPDEPADVLFANAVLQWVPDHDKVIPDLFASLRPGGALAFQVPNNFEEPSHRLMRELTGHGLTSATRERLRELNTRANVGVPAYYYDRLAVHARHVDIWQTTYEHVMPDAQAIVEWVRGTGLRPYLEALEGEQQAAFLAAYTAAIEVAYPRRANGKRLFSFPRLFVVAVR
ncbi:MAG: trans-aconitate 2-methyltransferase [Myxococcaceae bacterium]|nr:trans-aconitate 2-methyltransferase [Myxococcaceae bacterium]